MYAKCITNFMHGLCLSRQYIDDDDVEDAHIYDAEENRKTLIPTIPLHVSLWEKVILHCCVCAVHTTTSPQHSCSAIVQFKPGSCLQYKYIDGLKMYYYIVLYDPSCGQVYDSIAA